jgi:acetyl esterase/lipase
MKTTAYFRINTLLVLLIFANGYLFSQQRNNKVLQLYSQKAPESENWTWSEYEKKINNSTFVFNVTTPTLTVFEADKSIANGTAVIVCPGGAFHLLAMDIEGYDIAKWLNQKGITAFVLKYRLEHTLTDHPEEELMKKKPASPEFNKAMEPIVALEIADGKAAVAYVRSHAKEWNLNVNKIGIMGFSAGGTVSTGVAFKYDKQSRPDFVASIYPYVGSFGDPNVPADAPPLFIAVASDDDFGFNKLSVGLYSKWIEAQKSAELHVYRNGGHGFGINPKIKNTNTWIDRFNEWLINL